MADLDLSKFKKIGSDNKCTTLKHANGHELKIAHSGLSGPMKKKLDKLPVHAATGIDVGMERPTAESYRRPLEPDMPDAEDPYLKPVDPDVPKKEDWQAASAPAPEQQEAPETRAPAEAAASEQQTSSAPAEDVPTEAQPAAAAPAAPKPKQPQTYEEHKAATASNLMKEAQTTEMDVNSGHIKPKTYHDLFAEKSTLGKIGTIFGMLLSGAGAGLTHGPNMLMGMMNNEIANDLAAQEKSSTNKQNFLTINQADARNKAGVALTEQQTKGVQIENMAKARIQMNVVALHSLVVNAAKLPPGPQKQAADQQLAMLYQAVQAENYNIADKAAVGSAYFKMLMPDQGTAAQQGGGSAQQSDEETFKKQSNAMRMLGPEGEKRANMREARHIEGVPGVADRDIQDSDRKQLYNQTVLDKKLTDVLQFAKTHKGTLSPAQRRLGEQKAHELVNFYNKTLDSLGLTEGRTNLIGKQIGGNPTSMFQDFLGNNAALQEIKDSNLSRRNDLIKQYGFTGSGGGGKQGAGPSDSGAVKGADGRMYKKSADGKFMIPVGK